MAKTFLKIIIALFILLTLITLFAIALAGGFSKLDDPSLDQTLEARPIPELHNSQLNEDRNLYFGDLHIHTGYSTDAAIFGVKTLPDDAYRFAKGETIQHGLGYPIRISRPLDFAAVTDHSEYLGMMRVSQNGLPLEKESLREVLKNDNRFEITLKYIETTLHVAKNYFLPGEINQAASEDAWRDTIETAERHNLPGRFTTFIAYEWSSQPEGSNIHRNVIYRSSNVPNMPWSSLNSEDPEKLLKELQRQNSIGQTVFAIPHNGNLSNGLMYGKTDFNGEAISEQLAKLRNELEPVSEILQVKGSSETHPLLSSTDEFAGFEIVDANNSAFGEVAPPKGGYIRDAIRDGLELSFSEGFNPYKFGVIGSSDGHNSSSPVEENSYHGKLPIMDGSAGIRTNEALILPNFLSRSRTWGSGGLAAVWAKENTRESLFDAINNKETYATSGPRIRVRFFGGWNFPKHLIKEPDAITQAYQLGVPMGSTLKEYTENANDITIKENGDPALSQNSPVSASIKASNISNDNNLAPSFFIMAAKDPEGANLDRVQVIKLWLDKNGKSHEKVFNVLASDNREILKDGTVKPVGNTVNVEQATYDNTIGDAELNTLWTDPEFNPANEAAYYVRVIEIPTPRWSTYDAKTLGIKAMDPQTIQERAITSAIWYNPR